MSKYLLFITAGLCISLFASVKSCVSIREEKNRLEANQTSLLEKSEYYRTRDNLSAASVQQLTLTNSEFKRHNTKLVKEAEALKLKIKRLESASRTVTESVYQFETQWRDSIIYVDGRVDTIQCATYVDDWLNFDICGNDANIAVRDTIIQLVHRVPKQFLFIKYETKAIRQEVLSKNPYTKITYTEYIKLKR